MPYPYLAESTSDEQTFYVITHPKFSAKISKFGGQLLSFIPQGQNDILWLSDSAILNGSKPIRGGAPLCWPWFGPAAGEFEGEPQHGYIRNLLWEIKEYQSNEQSVEINLSPIISNELTEKLGLAVNVVYRFDTSVSIEINTSNVSDKTKTVGCAIHSYFNVEDITQTSLPELSGCSYSDKVLGKEQVQTGAVTVNAETDRVYHYEQAKLSISTPSRAIKIEHQGHDSVIVWNPWQQTAANMADFDNNGYLSMLCVEAGITKGVSLAPRQEITLKQRFSL